MKYDIVCSTKNLSTEEWLKIRTLGIGGSDAGIIPDVILTAASLSYCRRNVGRFQLEMKNPK